MFSGLRHHRAPLGGYAVEAGRDRLMAKHNFLCGYWAIQGHDAREMEIELTASTTRLMSDSVIFVNIGRLTDR